MPSEQIYNNERGEEDQLFGSSNVQKGSVISDYAPSFKQWKDRSKTKSSKMPSCNCQRPKPDKPEHQHPEEEEVLCGINTLSLSVILILLTLCQFLLRGM